MNLPKPKCATYYATVLYGEWLFLTTSHPPGSWPGRSERNRKLPSFPAATTNQARNKRSATVLQRYHYGITPMGIAMPMGVIPLQYRCNTVGTRSNYRQITVAVETTGREFPEPACSRIGPLNRRTKTSNIQQPTSNIRVVMERGRGRGGRQRRFQGRTREHRRIGQWSSLRPPPWLWCSPQPPAKKARAGPQYQPRRRDSNKSCPAAAIDVVMTDPTGHVRIRWPREFDLHVRTRFGVQS